MKENKPLEIRVSIDPSGNSAGLTLWKEETWKELCFPFACYVITPIHGKNMEWHNKITDVAGQVSDILSEYIVKVAYIEEPSFFETNRGQAAARSDSLVKLSAAYGAILYALSFSSEKTVPVPVNRWKGQLSKQIVARRIKALLPGIDKIPGYRLDAIDSTGIGLWAKGQLNQ